MMAATTETAAAFAFRAPETILERTKYYFPGTGRQYEISPDGRPLLVLKAGAGNDPNAPPRVVVVTNWFKELKQPVPTR